jgi:CheY-like chemotaxis protein
MARVLILDDELEILRLVADELRYQGHQTVAMRTPQLALELLNIPCNQFDLIICDVVMPSKNGIDFVKEIRKMPWF